MGLIITELRKRQPDLPYFDDAFEGEYPEEAPFTIGELEEIYPTASGKAKEDDAYREEGIACNIFITEWSSRIYGNLESYHAYFCS